MASAKAGKTQTSPKATAVRTARAPLRVHVINDCSGLSDPDLAGVVAKHDAALVVMHLKGELNVRDPAGYHYTDVMREIIDFLRERTDRALAAGVRRESIVIDPGLEFGKEPRTDLEILDRFGELQELGFPILFASSRKSFIGRIFGRPAKELLVPSLATAAIGITARRAAAAGARCCRDRTVGTDVRRRHARAACDTRPRRSHAGHSHGSNSASATRV